MLIFSTIFNVGDISRPDREREMSTATIELSSTRQKLFEVLGESQAAYLDHMKNWFRKKSSKEEFDTAARKLLSPECVHLHNQFLLAILNKCQTLVNLSPVVVKADHQELLSPGKLEASDRLKVGRIRRKAAGGKFQAVQPSLCAPEQDLEVEKSVAGGEVAGRLLVAAWEGGLEGAGDGVVSLTLVGLEQQMRKLIRCLVMSRTTWRQKGAMKTAIGAGPDPWLLNTQTRRQLLRSRPDQGALQVSLLNSGCVAPASREVTDVAQAEALYNAATAARSRHSAPLSLWDLLNILSSDRSLIPVHSVYSINMERIIARLHHIT